MKKPQKPVEPKKEDFIRQQHYCEYFSYNDVIDIKKLHALGIEKLEVRSIDDCEVELISTYGEPALQTELYDKAVAQYEKDLNKYKKDLEKWNIFKKSNAAFLAREELQVRLKNLQKQIKEAEKKLQDQLDEFDEP